MLIGGFFHVDLELLQKEPSKKEFNLRCDTKTIYNRKIYTNNGRTATVYALENCIHLTENDIVLLPDYLCLSVVVAAQVSKAKLVYYKINSDLTINMEDFRSKLSNSVKLIYIIHYFAQPQPQSIVDEIISISKQKNIPIIEDLTQALYTYEPNRIGFGDYIVSSTRKWMPVTDGGIIAVKDNAPCSIIEPKNAYNEAAYKQLLISLMRDYYNNHPQKDRAFYLQLEKEANKSRYIDLSPRKMTEITSRILFNTNQQELIQKRRENYTYLYENLKDLKEIQLLRGALDSENKYVPFGFVLLTQKRDQLYDYLIKHDIIGEIQWVLPTEYYTPGEDALYLSQHNIMLQCDQRYGEKEMEYVVQTIKKFFS